MRSKSRSSVVFSESNDRTPKKSYLDQYAPEAGSHGDAAHFDEEVGYLVARALGLHLGGLLGAVDARHLEHQHIEGQVGHEAQARVQQRKAGRRVLRVVDDVHGTTRIYVTTKQNDD